MWRFFRDFGLYQWRFWRFSKWKLAISEHLDLATLNVNKNNKFTIKIKICSKLSVWYISDFVDSIRLEHVGVPAYAIQGKKAVLECPFDLEGSSLYSVKWYKNGREFFRYNTIIMHCVFCRVWVNTFLKYWIPNTNIPKKFYWIPNTSILFSIWNVLKIPIPISIPNTFSLSDMLIMQCFSFTFTYLFSLELTKDSFSYTTNCFSKFSSFKYPWLKANTNFSLLKLKKHKKHNEF